MASPSLPGDDVLFVFSPEEELVIEHLGFVFMHFVDEVIDAANTRLQQGVAALERSIGAEYDGAPPEDEVPELEFERVGSKGPGGRESQKDSTRQRTGFDARPVILDWNSRKQVFLKSNTLLSRGNAFRLALGCPGLDSRRCSAQRDSPSWKLCSKPPRILVSINSNSYVHATYLISPRAWT